MSEVITHYTGGDAFTQILLNQSIRFGDLTCMNDYSESKHGLSEMVEKMKFSELEGVDKDKGMEMENEMKKLIAKCDEDQKCKFFSLSFSTDDDLLCMWNYYLKDQNKGGYNIGFDKEKFISYLYENVVLHIPNAMLLHGKIMYKESGDVPQVYDNLANMFIPQLMKNENFGKPFFASIEDIAKEMPFKNENDRKNGYEKFKEYCFELENQVNKDCLPDVFIRTKNGDEQCHLFANYFIKGYGFRDEREYRIIIAIPTEQLDTKQKDRKTKEYSYGTVFANGMIKSFIAVNFEKTSVEQVVISPYNSNRNPIKNTTEFCKNLEIDTKIKTSNLTVEF